MKGARRDGAWPHELQPGEYGRAPNGEWVACTPNGHGAFLNHEVTEHEDGTLTVSPSILLTGGPTGTEELYHGFLRAGEWT